jgi:8-oxo-dGTP pyrophosphatase MutT (NUDIX family)
MKYPKTKGKKQAAGAEPCRQYAAMPWRTRNGLEILLATSRETRRWIIPKGWPMKRRKPYATAAVEAHQEAGLVGKIEKSKLGSYHYQKRLRNDAVLLCRVDVFPLQVVRQRKSWPEKDQRVTEWFTPAEAAELVHEPELSELIRAFEIMISRGG